jgi:hypothetical protein
MSTNTTWALSATGRASIDAPYSGNGVAEFSYSAEWTSGTGDNQADIVAKVIQTVGATANVDLDLRAMTDANGDATNGAELAALIVEVPATASGVVTVKKSSANGAPILSGATNGIPLNAGARMLLIYPEDGGPALSGSAKSINLANAGASGVNVTVTAYFRSA